MFDILFVVFLAGAITLVMLATGSDPQHAAETGIAWATGIWLVLWVSICGPRLVGTLWVDALRLITRKSRWKDLE